MAEYYFKWLFQSMFSVSTAFVILEPWLIRSEERCFTTIIACVVCHTQQVHWRKKKMVTDQQSLIAQVDRWQRVFRLIGIILTLRWSAVT